MAKKKGIFNKLSNWFTQVFADFFGNEEVASSIRNWLNASTGAHMTDADKEDAALELFNQQILNSEEYARKKEFYEDYESPEAKVRQYQQAGLNPMLLAGGGASVSATGGVGSAGSASASNSGSPSGFGDVLGTIMQMGMYKLQKNQIRTQTLKEQEEANRIRIENKWKDRLSELDAKAKEQNIEVARTQGALNLVNLEKVAADTTFAKIYAQYAPDLFDVQIKQGLSTSAMNDAAAERNRAEASLSEARIAEVNSIVSRNEAEVRQINSLISKMRAEIELIGSQTDLTNQQKEESIKRCSKIDEEIRMIGKQIGLVDKDIEWYAANHTDVVEYDTSSPANPGAVFKDKSGVYTVFTNGKVNFRRAYQPGAANKPRKK